MKYFYLLLSFVIFFSITSHAQKNQHKIIFDFSSGDTADHSTIIRQVNNVLKAAPHTKIEVVFHGRGVYALVKDHTTIAEKIDHLVKEKHVLVAACNNSLIRFDISKDDLLSTAKVVPVAMLELSDKQQKGWSYIKFGR